MHRAFFLSTILAVASGPVLASNFMFDGGNNQGWEAVDASNPTPRSAFWDDFADYQGNPNDFSDPGGNNVGSIVNVVDTTGDTFAALLSPDLSGDSDWQNLQSFSGYLNPAFSSQNDYFGEARIVIDDTSSGTTVERVFRNSPTLLTNSDWNKIEFAGLPTFLASQGVTSYTTKKVVFQVNWDNISDVEIGFHLDDVTPIGADIPPPSTVPLPASGLLLLGGAALLGSARVLSRTPKRS